MGRYSPPLSEASPDLYSEVHITRNPQEIINGITYGSNKRIYWKCKTISDDPCGHVWQTSVSNRTRNGSNCPSCKGKAVHYKGLNSMRNTHPHLAESFHPTKNHPKTPDNILAGHGKRLWWLCPDCEHEWETTGTARKNHDSKCPHCTSGYLHSDGRNSLANNNSELSEDWNYEKNRDTPETVTFGSGKTVWWKCKECDHEWRARITDRNDGKGCAPCNRGDLHSSGINSFAARRPDLVAQLHPSKNPGFNPNMVVLGYRPKVWWLCATCNHEWETTIGSRASGHGCAPCNRGDLHSSGENSLARRRPDVVEEWHPDRNPGLSPDSVTVGHDRFPVWWVCKNCSHEWKTTVYSRVNGNGCGPCNRGDLRSDGSNSLESLKPDLALEWHWEKNGDVTPGMVTPGSNKRAWWICGECDFEWDTYIYSRGGHMDSGCPACKKKTQRSIFEMMGAIFPNEVIHFDFKHPELRFRKTNRKMELDIWVPGLKLAIEYQGHQHYEAADYWGGEEGLRKIQRRDKEKRKACKQAGIRLIEIKYTWEPDLESLKSIVG